jgi:hypothetical protein
MPRCQFRRPALYCLALGAAQRTRQQMLVEVGADQLHVPRLVVAEQVASAAHVEILALIAKPAPSRSNA